MNQKTVHEKLGQTFFQQNIIFCLKIPNFLLIISHNSENYDLCETKYRLSICSVINNRIGGLKA